MTEEVIIGIDLRTTYSACAVWQDGAAKVIPNSVGSAIAPSVVGLDDDGTVLVGQAAKERLLSHPDLWEANSCRTTKRRGSETLYLRDPASSQARNLEVSPFMRLRLCLLLRPLPGVVRHDTRSTYSGSGEGK